MNVDNTSQPCYTEAAKIREENTVAAPIPIGPTLSQIGQIFVNAKDLDRAIAFYRDTLGMTFLFQAPPNMAFFDCGGIRIMLGIADNPEVDHAASIIYYKVDDIEKVYEVLNARGVEFIVKPHLVASMPTYDLWLADFKDSEGNILALMSEVPKEVA
jgi:predicted enzyme related to lactoylglutathione lyase